MEDAMKNPLLTILLRAILVALAAGFFMAIFGLILGWKTSTQFSDGFFWAGAIVISLGVLNILGGRNQPLTEPKTSQTAVDVDNDQRFKLWLAKTSRGNHLLAILAISGLLLFGLAGLALLLGSLF
jgi:predicted phage tail protein